MIALARSRLQSVPKRKADEEDVAQEPCASRWRGAVQGCFPELTDREHLWPCPCVLPIRKARHPRTKPKRKNRRGRKVGRRSPDPSTRKTRKTRKMLLEKELQTLANPSSPGTVLVGALILFRVFRVFRVSLNNSG